MTSRKAHGWDHNSLAGDPMFVDPARGDFRVQDESPALKLGFKNFPMDRFGVQDPALKAIARGPELPAIGPAGGGAGVAAGDVYWQGAKVRGLEGEEFSAFGVGREEGGVHLSEVAPGSAAAAAGLRRGDLVQRVNDGGVKTPEELLRATDLAGGKPMELLVIREQAERKMEMTRYIRVVSEISDGEFISLPLLPESGVHPVKSVSTSVGSSNEPLAVLHDGRLARNYGPVFRNGVVGAVYKVELGAAVTVSGIRTWSYGQGGGRGEQRFTLYGLGGDSARIPLATVRAAGEGARFTASEVSMSDGGPLGSFHALEWVTRPVCPPEANTAFQEVQIR